jgi:hypothetical protein
MIDGNNQIISSEIVLLHLHADNTSVAIYPNPTESILNINLSGVLDNSEVNIHIVDASGKLVKAFSMQKNKNNFKIDLATLASGVYAAQIINRNNKTVLSFRKN